ncbi:MAG: hypothetical protein FJ042_00900 [Candidatus Cloacimonetes bacterium]|nr:hypothetical protein [Candidatus Cloacimonadota bacterium]
MKKTVVLIGLILLILSIFAVDNRFINVIARIRGVEANRIRVIDQNVMVNNLNQIWFYSLFNAWSPRMETSYLSVNTIEDLDLIGNRHLYICSREPTNTVIEIDSLNQYGKILFPYTITGDKITREGSMLYVADRFKGIDILDIGSGGNRELKSTFSEKWGILDFIAQYPNLYALNDFGLVTVDISELQFPISIGTNYEIINATRLVKNGDIVWIGAQKLLIAINIRDLNNPVLVNQYRFPYDIQDIEVKDNRLFVALGIGGIRILDIRNPSRIDELNWINTGTPALDLALKDDFVLVALGREGWIIYEYR